MLRAFIDTNVFVYAIDPTEPEKRERARDVLASHGRTRTGVISTQVVAEFTSVVSAKLRQTGAEGEAVRHARAMLDVWPVLAVDARTVSVALEIRERHMLSYWDAQILASAVLDGCDTVLTEDVPASHLLGVSYVDPF